jgi:hypothetical protein
MSPGHDRRRRRVRCAALLATAALVVAAGGCATARSTAAGSAPRPKPASPTAATPATISASGIPTGTQLQQLLPYHVGEPAGWHVTGGVAPVRNSGDKLHKPLGLIADSNNCAYIDEISDVLIAVPWWPVSWAYSTIESAPSGGNISIHVVDLLMAGFLPGYAKKQLDWEIARAPACPRFTDTLTGAHVAAQSTVLPHLGDGAVYIRNENGLGTSLVLITETIIARTGNYLVVAQQDSSDALVPLPELESMCRLLIQRVRAFR